MEETKAVFEELSFRFLQNLPHSELESEDRLFFQIQQAHWYYEDFMVDTSNSALKHLVSVGHHVLPET